MRLCVTAAAGRQLPTLQWLRSTDPSPQTSIVRIAVRAAVRTDLPTLQWLFGVREHEWSDFDVERVGAGAAAGAAVDKLDWLREQFPPPPEPEDDPLLQEATAIAAIIAGAVQSLQWLAAHGLVFGIERYTACAVQSRQLAALRYLIEDAHCPWNAGYLRRLAARHGCVQMLEWLRQADATAWTPPVLSEMLFQAGISNNLAAATWLRAQDAPWPDSFLKQDLEEFLPVPSCWALAMMQWARANGCPWGLWTAQQCTAICDDADDEEDLELNRDAMRQAILWAHAAGCPCDSKLHRCAAWLMFRRASGPSSDSSSGGSSSSSSKSGRWNAVVFKLCYTSAGSFSLK
jgi:hypothetical protein